MGQHRITNLIFLLILFISISSNGQSKKQSDYLLRFCDTITDACGYINPQGDTIIPYNKYSICFTDTLRTYAIVLKSHHGFIGIDKNQNFLFEVFPFDNGPDYTMDGLFRIISKGKIGFADSATGKIIIKPKFDCAFPFENGIAKVSYNCEIKFDGEYSTWLSNEWFYIDKKGRKVNRPMTK